METCHQCTVTQLRFPRDDGSALRVRCVEKRGGPPGGLLAKGGFKFSFGGGKGNGFFGGGGYDRVQLRTEVGR
jgi:hypothetical protein